MLKPVRGLAALAFTVCAASAASAQNAVPIAAAVDTIAMTQYDEWQPGAGWDRDIDVRCSSGGYNYNMCQVDTGRGSRVTLIRQISKTRCVEGRTWGWNRAGVWVDAGCEGIFRVQRRWSGGGGHRPGPGPGPGDGWRPGPGWEQSINVRCASGGYNYNMCQVDTGRGSRVFVARQISNTPCIEGRNWGWNRAGVWVDGGCEAIFTVERRWR